MAFFQYQNICYSTTSALYKAVVLNYPVFTGTDIFTYSGGSFQLDYRVPFLLQPYAAVYADKLDLLKQTQATVLVKHYVTACASPNDLYSYTDASLIFGFFFCFVFSLYLLTRASGLIIFAIKRM